MRGVSPSRDTSLILAEDLKRPGAPLHPIPWKLMERTRMESRTVKAACGTGGLKPKEPDALAYKHRRDAMPSVHPVNTHPSPRLVAQHNVDPPLSYDFKNRSPDVVRDPVESIRILLPPSRCRRTICRADMANLAPPTPLAWYCKLVCRRCPLWRHALKHLLQHASRANARGGVKNNFMLRTVINDEPYLGARTTDDA